MNTMNSVYFFRTKRQRFTISKTLSIIRKILIVASVYLVFGLLFKYVYASIDTANNSYQAQNNIKRIILTSDNRNLAFAPRHSLGEFPAK